MGNSDQPTLSPDSFQTNDNLPKSSPLSMSFEEVQISPGMFAADGLSVPDDSHVSSTSENEMGEKMSLNNMSESSSSENSKESSITSFDASADFVMVVEENSFVLVSEREKEKPCIQNDAPWGLEDQMSQFTIRTEKLKLHVDDKSEHLSNPVCSAPIQTLNKTERDTNIQPDIGIADKIDEQVGVMRKSCEEKTTKNGNETEISKVDCETECEKDESGKIRVGTTEENLCTSTEKHVASMGTGEKQEEAQIGIDKGESLSDSVEKASCIVHPVMLKAASETSREASYDEVAETHPLQVSQVSDETFQQETEPPRVAKDEVLLGKGTKSAINNQDFTKESYSPAAQIDNEMTAESHVPPAEQREQSELKESKCSPALRSQSIASKTEDTIPKTESVTSGFQDVFQRGSAGSNYLQESAYLRMFHSQCVVNTRNDSSPRINEVMFERGKVTTEQYLRSLQKGFLHSQASGVFSGENTNTVFPSWLNAKSVKQLPTLTPVIGDEDKEKMKTLLQSLHVAPPETEQSDKRAMQKKVLSYVLCRLVDCNEAIDGDFDGVVSWMEISLKVGGFSDQDIEQILQHAFQMYCPQKLSWLHSRRVTSSCYQIKHQSSSSEVLKVEVAPSCDKSEERQTMRSKCFACHRWVDSKKVVERSPYCADFCCVCRHCLLADVRHSVQQLVSTGAVLKIRCLSCFQPDASVVCQASTHGRGNHQLFKEWVFKEILAHLTDLESRRAVCDYLGHL